MHTNLLRSKAAGFLDCLLDLADFCFLECVLEGAGSRLRELEESLLGNCMAWTDDDVEVDAVDSRRLG